VGSVQYGSWLQRGYDVIISWVNLRVTGESTALFRQVARTLRQDIAAGQIAPGDQLPPEAALEERFGVSRITVRGAVRDLVSEGLVEIRRGRGTFVTSPKVTQELTSLTGFVEDMRAAGRHASAELVDQSTVPADRIVAERLRQDVGTNVVRIRRIRLADRQPVSFDETYLPLQIGQRIVSHDLSREPIFTLLEEKYDLPLIEAEYAMEAVAAPDDVAHSLCIDAGSPVFLIERTSYTTAGQPIDFEKLYYRGDAIRFVTRLARKPRPEQRQ
jgi:GntR family transcriptional regulator